jgi:hypothetical protein
MVESSSGAKEWDESHYDSSYNSYSGINKNNSNNFDNMDKDRIRAVHEEKEKQLVKDNNTFFCLSIYFTPFLSFRWTVRIWI